MSLAYALPTEENPRFLDSELITYIGNKRGLLPFIGKGVALVKDKLHQESLSFLDLFAGSGVVSRLMKQHAHTIVANDLELYAKIVNECYLTNQSAVDLGALTPYLRWFETESSQNPRPGFMAELYAPQDDLAVQKGERVFYTRRNAVYIDTVRQSIDEIPVPLQKFFLAPLIVEASIHANTAGVFKGFYKNKEGVGAFGGHGANALSRILGDITLRLPVLSAFESDVRVIQEDAIHYSATNETVFDLAYLDPPYNQHPYGSNYFMLNLIASYQRPTACSRVSGIPEDWTRSPFNKPQTAERALFSIIENLKARFLLISYNSEGFIKKDAFVAGLEKLGELTFLETSYNTYRGSRNLMNRNAHVTEYLFLLEKR